MNNFDVVFFFNRILRDLSYYTELNLNVLLIADLYYTLVNPFKPRRDRMLWYWLIWAIPTLSLLGYYIWLYWTYRYACPPQLQTIRLRISHRRWTHLRSRSLQ